MRILLCALVSLAAADLGRFLSSLGLEDVQPTLAHLGYDGVDFASMTEREVQKMDAALTSAGVKPGHVGLLLRAVDKLRGDSPEAMKSRLEYLERAVASLLHASGGGAAQAPSRRLAANQDGATVLRLTDASTSAELTVRDGALRIGVGGDGSAHLQMQEGGETTVSGPAEVRGALAVGGETRMNGTAEFWSGAIIGSSATAIGTIQRHKELHVVGAGSVADGDEQVRVTDGGSGLTLSLGADGGAAFVQATTPGSQFETLLLNPHGTPVGIGTTNPRQAVANGLTIHRPTLARLMVTNTAGAAGIVMGNRDSAGVDNPLLMEAANGNLYVGDGTRWDQSDGGGFDGDGPDFTMDTANTRLGIGVGSSPAEALDVAGNIQSSGWVRAESLSMGSLRLYSISPYFTTKETCSESSPCSDGRVSGYSYYEPGGTDPSPSPPPSPARALGLHPSPHTTTQPDRADTPNRHLEHHHKHSSTERTTDRAHKHPPPHPLTSAWPDESLTPASRPARREQV